MLAETHFILDTKVELKRALTKESTRNKLIDEKFRKMFLYGLKKSLSQSKPTNSQTLISRRYRGLLFQVWGD